MSTDKGQTYIVVRIPPAFAACILFACLISAGFLIYLWQNPAAQINVDERFVWVAAALCIATPLALFQIRTQYVLTESVLRKCRGDRVVEEYDLRDLEEVRLALGQKFVVFSGGRKVKLNDLWQGAAEAVAVLKALAEAKHTFGRQAPNQHLPVRGPDSWHPNSAPSTFRSVSEARALTQPLLILNPDAVELPPQYVTFPPRCVGCGCRHDGTTQIVGWRGFDVIIYAQRTVASLPIPTCHACRTKRLWSGILMRVLIMAALLGSLIGIIFWAGPRNETPMLFFAVVLYFPIVYFLRNGVGPWLDYAIYGVSVVKISRDGESATVRFANALLAGDVRALTFATHDAAIGQAQAILEGHGSLSELTTWLTDSEQSKQAGC